ncbi:MAG: hypothetical protein MJ000_11055 [Bacteroidales bacterium]|nr:hypothetical protein [Bacteroidales bacterium]
MITSHMDMVNGEIKTTYYVHNYVGCGGYLVEFSGSKNEVARYCKEHEIMDVRFGH